jgi:hypothetical protein
MYHLLQSTQTADCAVAMSSKTAGRSAAGRPAGLGQLLPHQKFRMFSTTEQEWPSSSTCVPRGTYIYISAMVAVASSVSAVGVSRL